MGPDLKGATSRAFMDMEHTTVNSTLLSERQPLGHQVSQLKTIHSLVSSFKKGIHLHSQEEIVQCCNCLTLRPSGSQEQEEGRGTQKQKWKEGSGLGTDVEVM